MGFRWEHPEHSCDLRDVSEEPSQTPALIKDHRSREINLKNLERRNMLNGLIWKKGWCADIMSCLSLQRPDTWSWEISVFIDFSHITHENTMEINRRTLHLMCIRGGWHEISHSDSPAMQNCKKCVNTNCYKIKFPTFTFILHVLSSNTHLILNFKNTNHLITVKFTL